MRTADMSIKSYGWITSTIHTAEGEVFARFDFDSRFVLHDEKYSGAIWFDLEPIQTSDVDEYFRDLDQLEDSIGAAMEQCRDCHLLLVLTEASGRELAFAYGGAESDAVDTIASLTAALPDRFKARILRQPQFGPFAALVRRFESGIQSSPVSR